LANKSYLKERLKNKTVEGLIEIVEDGDGSSTATGVESATTTGVEGYNVTFKV
jgi:hypothetical protein